MTTYEIPLLAAPQSFELTLGGTVYSITIQWQEAAEGGWFLDLATAVGDRLISGHALITGADLLEQYAHLELGVSFRVVSVGDADALPTFNNLGDVSRLYMDVP